MGERVCAVGTIARATGTAMVISWMLYLGPSRFGVTPQCGLCHGCAKSGIRHLLRSPAFFATCADWRMGSFCLV